ncbi:MAG: hypothetical protein JO122_13595 [Acetobacteraceae bacterium]|nr:hypothetical protein [Acetobacteraceae bacterium]
MSERLPRITDDDRLGDEPRIGKQGLGIKERLQEVEKALMDAGYEDFAVTTEHGSFHWSLTPKPAGD